VSPWETCDMHPDDQYQRDFVLKQPSTVGPWVALGLGMMLLAFLGYLVYVNLLLPSARRLPEPAFYSEAALNSPTSRFRRTLPRSPERRRQPATTAVPQGRAPNALLGGQGPALLPEHALPPVMPPDPPVSTRASAR
jgi:hypothetical protein